MNDTEPYFSTFMGLFCLVVLVLLLDYMTFNVLQTK